MANIVGLALKVTGDASGLAKSLTPVDRALDKLAAQAQKATNVFTPFAEKTAAAGRAQEEFAAKFSALADQLRDNVVGPQEYAAAFGQLTEEAKGAAAAFQEGLRITQQNQTAEQARTDSLERLNELLRLGAIDARNFGLESAKLSEGSDSTALDRFAEAIAPLRAALEGGSLSAERFSEQSQEIAAAISGSTPAAERQATAILELRDRFESGRVSIEQYREEFSRIQSGDIATTFEVQVVGVREGVEASNELRASLAQLTDKQITAALQVAGVEQLDDLRQQFANIDGEQIDAVLKVLGVETIEQARQQLESLSSADVSATVSIANAADVQNTIRSLESSFGSLEAAQSRLESLPDVDLRATLEVLGVDSIDAARERLIALGALQIEPKLQAIGFENIDAAQSAIESLSDRSVTATLQFLGAGTISDAAERLAALDGTTVEAFLQATGFESIDAAQAKLGELQDVDVTATLQLLGVDTIDAARDRLSQLGDLQIEPRLQAIGFESIDAARAALESLGDRSVTATLEFLGTDSIDDARERLGVIDGTTVEAFLTASGFDSIDAAQAKLAELQSVDVAATLTVLGVDTIDEARQRLASISTVDIEPVLRLLGVDSIDAARQQLAAVSNTEIEARLRVLGVDGIESARQQLAAVDGTTIDAVFQVLGVETIEAARQQLATVDGTQIEAQLRVLGIESVETARALIASVDGAQIDAVLKVLGVEAIEAARQQLASVDGTEIDTQLRVLGVDGIESAKALLASVEGKNVDLIAKTLGIDSVASLTQAIDAAESKTVTFDVASNANEEADRIAELVAEQDAYQAAVAEGLRVTEQVRTAEERRATELEKIERLLSQGAISEETAGRARDRITGASEAAAAAEQEFSRAKEQAGRIIEASLTATERAQRSYDAAIAQAQELERRGLLTKEQLSAEIRRQADLFAQASVAAGRYAGDVDKAGNAGLKFNELSGILGLLPGQIGGVASRLSSFASAGEGIQRLFAGGVTSAVTSLGTSLTGLVNPFSLAVAGITAFGAATSAVVSGLSRLDERVEKLSNTADKLGVSFEFIQTLDEAATRSGTSLDAVSAAFGRLQKSVLGVDEESKAAQKALEAIGVTSEQLAALNPEEQYRLIGEELRGIEDPAKRTATAVALFGKAGSELIPFFNNVSGAAVDVQRFNAQLSSIDRTRVDSLGGAFDNVRLSLSGLSNELLTPFIGITQSLGDGLSSAIATFSRSIGAVLDIFSPLTSIVGVASNLFLQFGATLGNIAGTVLEPFATAGRLISSAIDSVSRSLTAVFGRVNDVVIGFREFFRFEGVALQFAAAFDAIGETLERVGAIASRFAEVTGEAIGRVATIIGSGVSQFLEFTGLGAVVSRFADGVVAAFGGLYEGIRFTIGQVGGFIEQVLQFAEDWLGIVPEIQKPVEATVELNGGGAIEELLNESKEFKKTLDDITGSVSKAIDESAKFGQAGFNAALQYQESVDDLKAKLDAGLFNEETFRREAARAGEVFKSELARIEEEAKLDIQISDETQKTLDGLQDKINKVADDATQFGQSGFDAAAQFQNKLRELGQQFEDGRINATSLAAETAKATAEYDKQVAGFKAIDELQKSIVKGDQDRVAALLAQNNATTELEQNQASVQREQLRLEEEIRRQREDGNVFAADAAAARLAQLDQEAAKLEEIQQATEQGFTEGFQKSFEATAKSIDTLSQKAEEFGNVGALAAEALRLGVERAQLQARDDRLGVEVYEREVARQKDLFDQRLAAARRVEDFLANALGQRNKAELDAVAQLEERKKQAEVNVQAIQARIADEEQKRSVATNLGERRAATQRIAALRQAERIEGGIAAGRNEVARNESAGLTRGFQQAEQFQSRVAQTNDNFLKAFTGTYAAANASLNAANAVAAELARQQELSRPVAGSVSTADIRTAEGAALVLGLGAAAQDPNLIEARLQTKQLAGIRTAINNAVSGYIGTVAEIF
jgi:hypothetical protein